MAHHCHMRSKLIVAYSLNPSKTLNSSFVIICGIHLYSVSQLPDSNRVPAAYSNKPNTAKWHDILSCITLNYNTKEFHYDFAFMPLQVVLVISFSPF